MSKADLLTEAVVGGAGWPEADILEQYGSGKIDMFLKVRALSDSTYPFTIGKASNCFDLLIFEPSGRYSCTDIVGNRC